MKNTYQRLNHGIMAINRADTRSAIVTAAADCLKDILAYEWVAVAVQDAKGADVEIWADSLMDEAVVKSLVDRDFKDVGKVVVNPLERGRENAAQKNFRMNGLKTSVVDLHNGTARLYLISGALNRRHVEQIRIVSQSLGLALSREIQLRHLEALVSIDPLTGCYNRREMDRVLETHAARALRRGSDLSIILFDIDHFKQVNDQYGHPAGDAVLKEVAAIVKGLIRKGDYLIRYGGEEFVAVLPEAKLSRALSLAERLRKAIAEKPIQIADGRIIPVTSSFGVTAIRPDTGVEALIAEADKLLYQAKSMGRNRVVPSIRLYQPEKAAVAQ